MIPHSPVFAFSDLPAAPDLPLGVGTGQGMTLLRQGAPGILFEGVLFSLTHITHFNVRNSL